MPKRGSEEEIEFLKKRMKKLEKQVIRQKCANLSESSSSSSSSSSQNSSPRSATASRRASIVLDYPNDQDETARALEVDVNVDVQDAVINIDVPASPTAGAQPNSEPIPGPSTAVAPPLPGPPTGTLPTIAGVPEIINEDENVCQAELLDILGIDPSTTQEYGEDINKEVASRFEYMATSGLEKQARKELLDKFLVPSNCKMVAAPQLNVEIKAAMSDTVLKRDKAIELRQKQIAAAITSLGRILTSQLKSKEKDNNLLKQVMDTSRILCDIQHSESIARRSFTLYSLKKDFKEQLSNTKIDKYLFGADLSETLKTAKAVSKSVTDIKVDVKTQKQKPPNATRNLNWKAGPLARRQQEGPTQKQQPAALINRHQGTSSRKSSIHRPKHARHTRRQ